MPSKLHIHNPVNQIVGRLVTDEPFRERFVANLEGAIIETGYQYTEEERSLLASIRVALMDPVRRNRILADMEEFVGRDADEPYQSVWARPGRSEPT
jgi:hypothetical protein